MLISIIIPVYNKEEHLNECIKSVVYQDYKELEIIIINDGSTDNSPIVIKKWIEIDSRIKYINQKNKGVSLARNKGLSIAKGDYIFFLDADDYLKQNAIQKLTWHAKQTNADIVIGNLYENQDDRIIKKSGFESVLLDDEKDLVNTETRLKMFLLNHRHMAMAGNKLYKLDFIIENRIKFQQGILAEDRLFNLICYVNNPIIQLVNEYTYIYNKLDDSRSRSYNPNFYNESIALINHFYNYLKFDSKFEKNSELFQLIVIYDVNKIVSRTFKDSTRKIRMTNDVIKKLKKDPLITKTLQMVFLQRKMKVSEFNITFNRMLLISFLVLRFPYPIVILIVLGRLSRALKNILLGKNKK